jgi:hypothetical protein
MAQVIEIGEGRAISRDGVNWRLQIKSEIYKSPWSSLGIAEPQQQHFVYGVWSRGGELNRVPIHPTLFKEHVEEIAATLVHELRLHSQDVPFAVADTVELWLLDSRHCEPVVLIDSATHEEALPQVDQPHWSPLPANSESFDSEAFREQQRRASAPLPVRDILSRMVRQRTGSPVFGQWFRRHADGSATGLQPLKGRSELTGEHLTADHFPPLLIPTAWDDAREQQLINDYLAWLSPYLLTLPHLNDETRSGLEYQAVQRIAELEKVYRTYPKIINDSLIKSALVEAIMRRSV